MLALVIGADGHILECEPEAERLFEYGTGDLTGRHVGILLPELGRCQLQSGGLVNARLRFLCYIGTRFEAVKRNGERLCCNLFLCDLGLPGRPRLRVIIRIDGQGEIDRVAAREQTDRDSRIGQGFARPGTGAEASEMPNRL
jgi:PAS domain-containing protein